MNSITDVAREAKVATSTVSLVLNTPNRVSPKTRQRVEEAIRKLNYRPRSQKQRMHVGIIYARGMVFSGELIDFCRQWILGVRESFDSQGASVSVITAEPSVADDPMFQRALKEGDYEGLITMGVYESHGYVEEAVKAGVRVVAMNRLARRGEYSTVTEDHYRGGRLAARHLLERGHRKLGSGYLPTGRPANQITRQGFDDELAEWGAPKAVDVAFPEKFEDDEGFRRCARIVLDAGVTACFSGDPTAARLADTLIAEGVDVPSKVSVIGIDNRGFKTSTGLRLTSLATNSKVMGQLAAEILQHLMSIGSDLNHMTATVPLRIAPGGETVATINA